jgi:hypothetical protein
MASRAAENPAIHPVRMGTLTATITGTEGRAAPQGGTID